jgi:hypothetical protein
MRATTFAQRGPARSDGDRPRWRCVAARLLLRGLDPRTPDQIRQFQDYWDTEFAGDLARRRRAKFVPGDSAVKVQQTKEPEQKNDFDEWLARIICYAFSVPPQWATKVMNRAMPPP